jgi:6,7-dimethyl-8-ribityllumazine synthase
VSRDIDDSSENVVADWSRRIPDGAPAADDEQDPVQEPSPELEAGETDEPDEAALDAPAESAPASDEPWRAPPPEAQVVEADDVAVDPVDEELAPMIVAPSHEHAVGELEIPDGYAVLEGVADGGRRAVGVVVARFNGGVTSRLLEQALQALDEAGVRQEAITVMVVPGAFELPLAATALAKTRRFACIVALGCVIRGDTPHFDYVASEAASGLQLAALETGVPVSFGVLTLDRIEQADPRVEKGAEAVRTALEMADVFSHLRAAASR